MLAVCVQFQSVPALHSTTSFYGSSLKEKLKFDGKELSVFVCALSLIVSFVAITLLFLDISFVM